MSKLSSTLFQLLMAFIFFFAKFFLLCYLKLPHNAHKFAMLMFMAGVLIILTQANRNALEQILKSITDNVAANRIVKLLSQTALFSAILA